MKRQFRALLIAIAMMAPLAAPAQPEDGEALLQLVEQARFWEARDAEQRASEAWQRVLAADPDNEEALGRLAALRVTAGERGEAEALAERLRARNPDSRWLQTYREARLNAEVDREALRRARELAGTDRPEEALEAYRRAFDGETPPPGTLAREYFEVMGGMPERRAEAIEGLRDQENRHPEDPRYTLARARVQSYQAATRRAALDTFESLQRRTDPPEGLKAAWRQTLLWLDAEPADMPRYERYLAQHAPDAEVAQRRAALADRLPGSPRARRDAAVQEAFAELDAGDVGAAESTFSALRRQSPRSAEAAGGLGLVRLRQERFAEASELLDEAMRLQPATAGRWESAARSARFFQNFEQAQSAEAEGEDELALAAYERAFSAPPAGLDPALRLPYAELLLRQGRIAEAESLTRQVRQARPESGNAVALLVRILIQRGEIAEAEALAKDAPPEARAALAPARARALRERAGEANAAGDRERAKAMLREAIALAPDSPWPRLDLARILREEGQQREADRLLDSLASTHPELEAVRLAQAYALADAERWGEVLEILEALPAAQRDREAEALQRRAWIRYQIERARLAREAGDYALAFRAMSEADAAASNEARFAGVLAGGWAELGDPARALAYLRRAFADAPDDIGQRLQYAGLLLEMGHYAEFEAQAEHLLEQDLNTAQSAQLEELIIGFRIAMADRERQEGELDAAYSLLRDVVRRRPREPRVQMALARVFEAGGDHAEALAIYDNLVARLENPEPELLRARINALLAAGHLDPAERALRELETEGKDDPELYELRARLADARGNEGLALRHYQRARSLRAREPEGRASLQPPQLAIIEQVRRNERLTPRPVRDAMQERSPEAPEQVLRPRPGAFAEPVAPAQREARSAGAARASEGASGSAGEATARRIDTLSGRTSGWAAGGFHSRVRDGEAGLSRLFNLEVPMELYSAATRLGRFGLRVTPVLVDSGDITGPRRLRFGTLALIDGGDTDLDLDQSDSGIAVGLRYAMGSFRADVGSTPLGFAEERLVGGIRWAPSFGPWQIEMALSRRAVSDSVLSYAGTRDPLTGLSFGGVNRTGARVDIAYEFGDYGVYGNAGFRGYDGRNTDDNSAFEIGAGAYARALRSRAMELTYGLNITSFFYDKNRRFFTLGHGGYFSPQSFVSVGVPVSLEGRYHELVWRLHGAVGLQAFNEDGAAYYPNNPGLQAQLEERIALDPESDLVAGYSDNSQSGLGYAFGAAAEYRLNRHFFAGGRLATDNARDFNEYQFAAFLRYYFNAQPELPASPRGLPSHYEGSGL